MYIPGNSLSYQDERFTIQNIDLISLAKEYGTPLYVYDGDLVLKRYQELYQMVKWPKLRIYYAIKANYNVGILRILQQAGASVEAVSLAEVLLALKSAYPPEQILYTANNITDSEMERVKKTGVLLNIGSLSRLRKYGQRYPGTDICLRINPDVVAGENPTVQTGGALTKFGILMQDIPEVQRIVKQYRLRAVGLHEHTGSGIAETEKVYQSMRNLLSVARKTLFPDLKFIDFGGGLKVPYEPGELRINSQGFGTMIGDIFSTFCRDYGRELDMYFEPGKYLVAEAGHLVVRVNTLKSNRSRLIAGTDSGFPQLIRPLLYDAYHHIVNLSNPQGQPAAYDVVGNICETGDRFALAREMPEIREGDYLSILNAGAYCYAMGGIYNLRPLPAEVLIFQGRARLARQALSSEELVNQIMAESPWARY